MKWRSAGLAGLIVLLFAAPAAADGGSLHRYAHGHVGVVRRDDRRADRAARPTRSRPTARAACRPRRRTSARTCGARWWPRTCGSSATARPSSGCTGRCATLERMERHAPSGQFYNWYDHRTGEKLTTWPPSGEPLTPILSSVDNGWLAVGLRVVASRVPELRWRAQALYDSMNFGFYYRPAVNRILFHYVPGHRRGGVLLRHDRLGEPDRELHRDREGRDPAAPLLRRVPVVPRVLRLVVGRDAADRLHAHLLRRRRLRGRLSVQRHARDAVVGREHVRGADAAAVRARGPLGPGQLGRQPPADGAGADPPRADRGGLRLLGLLAREHPRGRLHGVRRRRDRHEPERLRVQQRPRTLVDHGYAGCPDRPRCRTRRRPRTRTAS